jgi:hypothetical protein
VKLEQALCGLANPQAIACPNKGRVIVLGLPIKRRCAELSARITKKRESMLKPSSSRQR